MTHIRITCLAVATALAVAGTAHAEGAKKPTAWGPGADDKTFAKMLKSDFKDNAIATVHRLDQDETLKFCSDPVAAAAPVNAKTRDRIEAENLATIKYPADGVYLGDWKEGEKIAQNGRGLTWTDKADMVNGGNCYNCHQITAEEIAHGTIGPSLLGYGKVRGYSEDVVKYTWGKIFNGKAYNACSNMPRAGYKGVITEQQIKHLMALLLDPASPVNK